MDIFVFLQAQSRAWKKEEITKAQQSSGKIFQAPQKGKTTSAALFRNWEFFQSQKQIYKANFSSWLEAGLDLKPGFTGDRFGFYQLF